MKTRYGNQVKILIVTLLHACVLLYASNKTILNNVLQIPKTTQTPVIDGQLDDIWLNVTAHPLLKFAGAGIASVDTDKVYSDHFSSFRVMWSEQYLYVFVSVVDDSLFDLDPNWWDNDCVELFFDGGNEKTTVYDNNDVQFAYVYGDNPSTRPAQWGRGEYVFSTTLKGYNFELRLHEDSLKSFSSNLLFPLETGQEIGFEVANVDRESISGTRQDWLQWWSADYNTWQNASLFGTAVLSGKEISSTLKIPYTSNGKPTIDGMMQEGEGWEVADEITLDKFENYPSQDSVLTTWGDHRSSFWTMWNEDYFYLFAKVVDDSKEAQLDQPSWVNDCVWLFFDGGNEKTMLFDDNDSEGRYVYNTTSSTPKNTEGNRRGEFKFFNTDEGYNFELRIHQDSLISFSGNPLFTLQSNTIIGFEISNIDRDGNDVDEIRHWWTNDGNTWHNASLFGTAILYGGAPNPTPSVRVSSPNGGEKWEVGSLHNITWTKNLVDTVNIKLSTNNGSSWTIIVENILAELGSYSWNVPNTPSSSCRIKISNKADSTIFDISNNVFSIFQPSITLTVPHGSESWTVTSTRNIFWTQEGVDNIKIEYSTNNGALWINVVSTTSATTGKYSWLIPNTPSTECKIRLTDISDGSVYDENDTSFTISETVVLKIPKMDAAPLIDGILDDVWLEVPAIPMSLINDVSNKKVFNYNDHYSEFRLMWTDNYFCAFVRTFDDSLDGSDKNAPWDDDCIEFFFDGGNEKKSFYDNNDAQYRYVYGESPGNPSLQSNVGTYKFLNTENGYDFELRIHKDSLKTYSGNLLFPLEVNHTIGFEILSADRDGGVREQILNWWTTDYTTWNNASLFGTAVLHGESFPQIKIISPNGGETIREGTQEEIAWTSGNVEYIKLEYTTDNGISWTEIIGSNTPVPAEFPKYVWTVPNSVSSECRVRISDIGDSTIIDASNGVFSIVPNYFPANPVIQSIQDVPDDNGKHITVTWTVPMPAASNGITKFGVWRRDSVWTFVDEVLSLNDSIYAFVSPTIFDSTKSKGMFWSVFKISAHGDSAHVFTISKMDSGYSIDNRIPQTPTGLLASYITGMSGNAVQLRWNGILNDDLHYYQVYRDTIANFTVSFSKLIKNTADTVFIDNNIQTKKRYYYKIIAADYSGNFSNLSTEVSVMTTSVGKQDALPIVYSLSQNYPNPFNPSTTISFALPENSFVIVKVYDLLGREIGTLVNEDKAIGFHDVVFNASYLSSGIYIYRMTATSHNGEKVFNDVKKLLLMK